MTGHIHILRPKGYYLGQVRIRGHRLWRTVAGKNGKDRHFRFAQDAMVKAILTMGDHHLRARVLFCTEWYDPLVVMEAKRS